VNPDNILDLEDTAFFGEFNTQFTLSYLYDYQFKTGVGFQYSPGSSEQADKDTHFMTNEYYLDLFVAQTVYLKAGKKRNPWGVGWTFSPVDDVMDWPKNTVDPTESREGKYLAVAEVPIGNASLSFIYFPDVLFDMDSEAGQSGIPDEMNFDDPSLGGRIYFFLWDTDISIVYNRTDKTPDYEKDYFGLTFNRYWGDLGAYAEVMGHEGNDFEFVKKTETGQYYFPSGDELVALKKADDDLYVNFALGANYSFEDNTKISAEYFRNDEGYDDDEFDEFVHFLEHEAEMYLLLGDGISKGKLLKANQILQDRIRQNYVSLAFDRPFTFDDFNPHLGATMCVDDSSFLLNGALEYNVRDDTTITLDVKAYIGDGDSEFGIKPDDFKVLLKAKYYF
jgi:hypothetical protein